MAQKKLRTETGAKKATIVIVDDHPIVRQGLADLLNEEQDLAVIGQAEDAPEAMQIIRKQKPDIVIIDVSLKETSGIELIKDIKALDSEIPVLTLSMHDESLYAERALRAGAKGYIMKQEATDKIVNAIRTVLKGQLYLSDRMSSRILRKIVGGGVEVESSPIDRLSDRELEVFTLLGQGHGTRQISEQLHLSIKTIETYRSHIKEKLDLADSTELLQHAIQWVNSQFQ
jgi:DNA-binding NarL/FixJ family response regulator